MFIQDAIPGLFGALFGAGVLGWGAGWIGAVRRPAEQALSACFREDWSASADRSDIGTVHKVCANPASPVHHPKQKGNGDDEARWKAQREKERREQAIANATGLRVLSAIGSAVPVRLLKRDLLFVIERLMVMMDESRFEMLARQHGIRQKRDDGGVKKTLTAFVRRADESTLSRLMVEASVLLAASRGNATTVLKEAATVYKVDTEAIASKVRHEFAAKEKQFGVRARARSRRTTASGAIRCWCDCRVKACRSEPASRSTLSQHSRTPRLRSNIPTHSHP